MTERSPEKPGPEPDPEEVRRRKDALRQVCLARRDALPEAQRAAASQKVCDSALAWLSDRPRAVVSAFWPIRSEIDLRPLMGQALARGFALALPRIDRGELTFHRWDGDERSLVDGGFGTRVPASEAPMLDPDIVLVPLAAFDATGGRIGYGKGYYDAALARLGRKRPFIGIGVGFEAQRVEWVPMEAHDWFLDWLATEAGLRQAQSRLV
jgi:5-formyltetrahydrofolate cyclo-ligase